MTDRRLLAAGVCIVNAPVQHAASSSRVLCRARVDKSLQPHLRCWGVPVLGVLCAVHGVCGVLCVLDAQRAS